MSKIEYYRYFTKYERERGGGGGGGAKEAASLIGSYKRREVDIFSLQYLHIVQKQEYRKYSAKEYCLDAELNSQI